MRALVEASRSAGRTFAEIADRLNGAGFRPASARFDRFTPSLASELMYRLGLSPARRPDVKLSDDECWISDLKSELGLRLSRLGDWARKGYSMLRRSARRDVW
jgi:hypothetical protein